MLLFCLLLVTQLRLSVFVEASGWNTTTLNEKVDSIKKGTQIGTLSEEFGDDEDHKVEASADGGEDDGSQMKDSEKETSLTVIISVVCSVIGLVVLLVLVGVVLSCRKKATVRGDYALAVRAAE